MAKLEFFISIDTDTQEFEVVNKSTGESKTLPVRTKTKKVIPDENPNPQLTLSDTKYTLNTKAVELMKVEPDMRLDIKFDGNGIPVIGTDVAFGTPGAGNKLTKSHTVRYSGNNNARLAERGTIFDIEQDPVREGIFILKGDKPYEEPKVEDEKVEVPDEIDLAELIDLADGDKTEVKGLDFNLNF